MGDLRALLALPPLAARRPLAAQRPAAGLLRLAQVGPGARLPRTAEAQAPHRRRASTGPARARPSHPGRQAKARPPLRAPAPGGLREPPLSNWSLTATATDRGTDADRRAARYAVEVHKKWAISMACISFVIIGIVMALRFPRGGIGLVIGGGLLVFSVHYVGLTAGESLADRGFVSPWAGHVGARTSCSPSSGCSAWSG